MAAVVQATDLTKRYANLTAVDGISFEVERGRFYGLLGPNGAGKSTTMRMIYQVTPPSSGRLEVFGMPSGVRAREIKRRMGVVPQLDNLDEELTVEDNLRIYARFNGITGMEAERRTSELLEFAELSSRRTADVRQLSGGMKRRLTLARGLMNTPELLILDEPTTGLDPQVRLSIWEKLDALRSQGITLLMSTHYMDEAERLCDHLLIMDHGSIIAQGTPRDLIRRHLRPFVVEARVKADDWQGLTGFASRNELEIVRSGERVSIFVEDGASAVDALQRDELGAHGAFVRPSNLEDVFLKLTGRSLRE
ncbi:MAG TPA: ABC transporter ATP-binding protein [Trueperaceae bacterium]